MPRLLFRFLSIFAFAAATLYCLAADRVLFTRLGPTHATLFISNADGSAERPLTQPGSLNYNPAWSPRGDWIVFTSEREGPANLFRMHPDGSEVERLTADAAYDDQRGLPMAAGSPSLRTATAAFPPRKAVGSGSNWSTSISFTPTARGLGLFRNTGTSAAVPDGRLTARAS